MLILTIRTDKPEAELGLYQDDTRLAYTAWAAHRELAETIQDRVEKLLKEQSKQLADIQGIVAYQGPGSFTGLRIGLTVANALAYSLQVPIVATGSPDWIKFGQQRLASGQTDTIAMPEYGSEPNITLPRK